MSRVAPGENLTVLEASGRRTRTRRVLRVEGASDSTPLIVHNNSLPNALRAVRERVFAVQRGERLEAPPRPARGVFGRRLADFRAQLLRKLGQCTPWTESQFLASYTGSKLRRYTAAVASLRVREITRSDSYLQSFVKAEAVNVAAKPDPAPRLIQPRGARYNVKVGCYLRPLEHRVYAAIASLFGGPTVMKGYNAQEVAGHLRDMWGEFSQPVSLPLDASRFDQHVSRDALEWEHSVYNAVYHSRELAQLLRWQLSNTGFVRTSDGAFKYQVEGCRMSGDMNTALGNCLLMCALVWAYARHRGVRVRLANNGDDCSVIMERRDLNRFKTGLDKWFLEMGFTLTSDEPAEVFEHIEFCQTRPVYTERGWVMCRSPRTGMAKDTLWKTPDMNQPLAGYLRWMFQVGQAGQALCDGVPVFHAAYTAMVRNGTPCRKVQGFGDMSSGFEHLAQRMVHAGTTVSCRARVSFWRAWGITPDQQVTLEEHFARLGPPAHCRPMMQVGDSLCIWLTGDKQGP